MPTAQPTRTWESIPGGSSPLLLIPLAVLSSGAATMLSVVLSSMLPVDLTPDEPQAGRDLVRLLSVAGESSWWVCWCWPRAWMGCTVRPEATSSGRDGLILLLGAALLWQHVRPV